MSTQQTSQEFESYVPVYDSIPEEWKDAQPFIVEQLKKISNAVNVREIGFFLNDELLSGKSFFSSAISNPPQFRSMFRKVIDCSPVIGGVTKTIPHGINFDTNFSLIQLYAGATNSGTLLAEPIPNGSDTISMNATNIIINTAASYDRVYCTIEYILEK